MHEEDRMTDQIPGAQFFQMFDEETSSSHLEFP
jgi:hypothetical protein